MEVGEYYTRSQESEPNVWIVDSTNVGLGGYICKLRLVSGSSGGFSNSGDGLYPFCMSQINRHNSWVKITPKGQIMAHRDIKKHTLWK
jgi:hypothetical protein